MGLYVVYYACIDYQMFIVSPLGYFSVHFKIPLSLTAYQKMAEKIVTTHVDIVTF